jgi:CheY-like chemotaxis protein
MSMVLVVDDEAGARRALMRLLTHAGYETVGAGDGFEALRSLEAKRPDVVLLDLVMPGMDGLELMEALHAHPQFKALPVVVLTALSDTHTVNRAQQLGAKAFLVKATFSVAEMLDQVKRYAGNHA